MGIRWGVCAHNSRARARVRSRKHVSHHNIRDRSFCTRRRLFTSFQRDVSLLMVARAMRCRLGAAAHSFPILESNMTTEMSLTSSPANSNSGFIVRNVTSVRLDQSIALKNLRKIFEKENKRKKTQIFSFKIHFQLEKTHETFECGNAVNGTANEKWIKIDIWQ